MKVIKDHPELEKLVAEILFVEHQIDEDDVPLSQCAELMRDTSSVSSEEANDVLKLGMSSTQMDFVVSSLATAQRTRLNFLHQLLLPVFDQDSKRR